MEITKYCEPMVGAGAVLFDVLNTYEMDEVYICDTNSELINTYTIVRDHPDCLIRFLSAFENDHLSCDNDSRKDYYYQQRERFNTETQHPTKSNSILRAALFIYLNKTCFNGLYRVNRKGLFNVPMGSYKNPTICDTENIKKTSELLQGVTILVGDYTCIDKYVRISKRLRSYCRASPFSSATTHALPSTSMNIPLSISTHRTVRLPRRRSLRPIPRIASTMKTRLSSENLSSH